MDDGMPDWSSGVALLWFVAYAVLQVLESKWANRMSSLLLQISAYASKHSIPEMRILSTLMQVEFPMYVHIHFQNSNVHLPYLRGLDIILHNSSMWMN